MKKTIKFDIKRLTIPFTLITIIGLYMKIFYEKIEENGLALDYSFSFNEDNDNFEKVVFSGNIIKTGDVYTVTGNMEVKFTCPCDRCLEPVNIEFKERIIQAISPIGEYPISDSDEDGLSDEEAGLYVTPVDYFDLEEFLRAEALLLIPVKRLCSQNCKGICVNCGALLNIEKCSCATETDFRWEALKKLKDN